MLSTHIHALFGYTLLGVGAGRIIEVCFLLKDKPTGEEQVDDQVLPPGQWYPIRAFQYLCVELLPVSLLGGIPSDTRTFTGRFGSCLPQERS